MQKKKMRLKTIKYKISRRVKSLYKQIIYIIFLIQKIIIIEIINNFKKVIKIICNNMIKNNEKNSKITKI